MDPLVRLAQDARATEPRSRTVVAVEVGVLYRHHGVSEGRRHLRERGRGPGRRHRGAPQISLPARSRSSVVSSRGGMSGSSVDMNNAARAPVTESVGRRTDRIAIQAKRLRLLVVGGGAAAAQASSRVGPGGPSVRSRVVGIALIASGANGVEHLPGQSRPQTSRRPRTGSSARRPGITRPTELWSTS